MRPSNGPAARAAVPPADVLVVGAGPAGLAVGACLARSGLRPILLERGDAPGWSWACHYESLRLHTPRRSSSLPFLPMPPGGTFPSRAEVADYLVAYSRRFGLDVRTGVAVLRISPGEAGGWIAESPAGTFAARACVVATGANRLPRMPQLQGRELFRGPILHSGSVRNGRDLAGRRVLVAGLGNSGGDLAADVAAQGARVSIAVGRIGPVLPLRVAGMTWRTATLLVPGAFCAVARRMGAEAAARKASASFWTAVQERHAGDLRRCGLPLPTRDEMRDPALWSRPPFTSEPVLSAIRRGEIDLLPRLVALGEREAVLEGGRVLEIDALLLATGFRHGLEEILPGLVVPGSSPVDGALGEPGLFLCGFAPELRLIARAARTTAAAVERVLR